MYNPFENSLPAPVERFADDEGQILSAMLQIDVAQGKRARIPG
jgi:hypothetical protein